MRELNGIHHGAHNLPQTMQRQPTALLADVLLQARTIDPIHHDREGFALFDDIHRAHDAGMFQIGLDVGFLLEPHPDLLALAEVRQEYLERDIVSQLHMTTAIDHSHATGTHARDNFVVAKDCPGLQHGFPCHVKGFTVSSSSVQGVLRAVPFWIHSFNVSDSTMSFSTTVGCCVNHRFCSPTTARFHRPASPPGPAPTGERHQWQPARR